MKYVDFTELTTLRLRLRKLRENDAEDFYKFGSDTEVSRYMLWKPHTSIDESARSIESTLRKYDEGKFYRWGIALIDTDTLIGMIQLLRFDESNSSCSFAYMLNKDYWNKGLGTEVLSTVIQFAFEEMQIEMIEADHMSGNSASGAVMRKCGMVFTGTAESKYEKDGELCGVDSYVITKSRWDEIKGNAISNIQ